MKKLYRLLLAPGLLALALLLAPCQAYAAESTAEQTAASAPAIDASQTEDSLAKESQATLTAPGSHIETVPADDVPIEEAPSSKNSNDTMMVLLEFVVLWSVIYIVIKLVRRKLEKDRPFK
ncbi:MAG: hypothetical protein ACI4U1_04255 [Anaerovoracaceae bacterium]